MSREDPREGVCTVLIVYISYELIRPSDRTRSVEFHTVRFDDLLNMIAIKQYVKQLTSNMDGRSAIRVQSGARTIRVFDG